MALRSNQLFSKKAIRIIIRVIIGILLLATGNVFYNWAYFKQYSGPPTTRYKIAYGIQNATELGISIAELLLVIAVFAWLLERKKG